MYALGWPNKDNNLLIYNNKIMTLNEFLHQIRLKQSQKLTSNEYHERRRIGSLFKWNM